jgi:hypothetical protein
MVVRPRSGRAAFEITAVGAAPLHDTYEAARMHILTDPQRDDKE